MRSAFLQRLRNEFAGKRFPELRGGQSGRRSSLRLAATLRAACGLRVGAEEGAEFEVRVLQTAPELLWFYRLGDRQRFHKQHWTAMRLAFQRRLHRSRAALSEGCRESCS